MFLLNVAVKNAFFVGFSTTLISHGGRIPRKRSLAAIPNPSHCFPTQNDQTGSHILRHYHHIPRKKSHFSWLNSHLRKSP